MKRVCLVFFVFFVLFLRVSAPAVLEAAEAACTTSGPLSDAYTVTVCLEQPLAHSTVTGVAPVEVSMTVTGQDPRVRRMIFFLDDASLLTDFAAPYTFDLPSEHFVDGIHTLSVRALMRDGYLTEPITVDFSIENTGPPPIEVQFTPYIPAAPPAGQSLIVAATGDGANGLASAQRVVDLITTWNIDMFMYLGDVYEDGTYTEFYNWYGIGDQYFGRFRAITNPTVGNHEYTKGVAPGYFKYWLNAPKYYSLDAAGWHLISLNSNGDYAPVVPRQPPYEWLENELTQSRAACTLVFFHHPVYSVGPQGDTTRLAPLWSLLAQHGVDIVLTGHEHNYQRWLPLDQDGNLDPQGITQFVAGAGGHGIQGFVRTDARVAYSDADINTTYGALRLALNRNGSEFQYINIDGTVLDSGVIPCSGAEPDTIPPDVPQDLSASIEGTSKVRLHWSPSSDDTGVSSYTLYRYGVELMTVAGTATSYLDQSVLTGETYTYSLDAVDSFANRSTHSNTVRITVPHRSYYPWILR